MSQPPTQRSRGEPGRGPASERISHRQATDQRQGTAHGTVLLPVPSLTAALDHLDSAGLCACWITRRRCLRRWSP